MDTRSLTRDEARQRADVVRVERYDIDVDLSEVASGGALRATSTVRFSASPGASTFVDCAAEVTSAVLNGRDLPPDVATDARIRLDDLADGNVLVVESAQPGIHQGRAVHRAVDPADGEAYVWTTFEPDDARWVWACFDQPDLKAPFGFTVTAPAPWTVLSNSGGAQVEDLGVTRRWTFADTPPLATYVPVVNAGPFHDVRDHRGGYYLGLLCRRSLAPFLDRDADELFELTGAGLAFFGDRFGMPFPQRRYDQVFLPEFGGAMENWGCVSWSDVFVYRSTPSPGEREQRASVLLHEMAHMWFGDLVTMRWWDDLWLNEAFAEWASYWAAASATRFTDAWATFLAGRKTAGYKADRAPTTHPVREPAPDVAHAAASFDPITYCKGAGALKQLVAYVGEESFVQGLRSYFRRHAWGNASLDDLVHELAAASGRDLSDWTRGWLDSAGTDLLRLQREDGGRVVVTASGPGGVEPRPHRLDLGVYDRQDAALTRRRAVAIEIAGTSTPVPDLGETPDLLLLNDDDLTFATIVPDDDTLRRLLESAGDLPTALSRGVAVTTLWSLLADGHLSARDFVRCAVGVAKRETSDSLLEPLLELAIQAAELWTPDAERDAVLAELAHGCLSVAEEDADAEGARRRVALRAASRGAVTEEQLGSMRTLAGDDVDLSWRVLTREAALGRFDRSAVEALAARDPDPDSWVRGLAVEAARPEASAKQAAWVAAVEEHRVPPGTLRIVGPAFWQALKAELLAPYAERFLEALPAMGRSGMVISIGLSQMMFPRFGVDAAYVDRLVTAAAGPDVTPTVAGRIRENADELRRMLRARGAGGRTGRGAEQ